MANEFNINESALDAVLAEVTGEIAEMLRKDEAALVKAADEKGPPDDEPAESSEGSSGPADPVGDEGDEPPAPAEEAPEASEPASPEQAEAAQAPDGSPEHEAGEIEPAPTVEELQGEYAKLDPEALKMHYLACKAAIMAAMGGGDEASAGAPPAPPAAPPAPAPEASAPPALKGEMKSGKQCEVADEIGGQIKAGKMAKSETEVELDALKAQVAAQAEQLKKSEETMIQLAELVAKPLRKSIKGLSDLAFIAKEGETEKKPASAGLSKQEITTKLREKSRTADLSKNDRDLINQYTVGAVDVSKIEHLLTAGK